MAIEIRHTGGATNQFPVGDLGGAMSNYQVTDSQLENLFDNVNRVEIINGRIDYRCLCIYNPDNNSYYRGFLASFTIPDWNEIEIAIELGSSAQVIADETTDPVGLTFFKIADWEDFRAAIGQLKQYSKFFIWFRRKVIVGTGGTLTVSFYLDGTTNSLTITQDFNSTMSNIDNIKYDPHKGPYRTDESFAGEALAAT